MANYIKLLGYTKTTTASKVILNEFINVALQVLKNVQYFYVFQNVP